MRCTRNLSTSDSSIGTDRASSQWRWASAWVLCFVACWPAPGIAEGVLSLGALVMALALMTGRVRGTLLPRRAWALTCVLFFAYWLPQLVSALDAADSHRALYKVATGLRHLPVLWLAAAAVTDRRGREVTFIGLGWIVAVWTLDALIEAGIGVSPLFRALDASKQMLGGEPICNAAELALSDRLGGALGPCNLKLGPVLASLSPFALAAAARRGGAPGWLLSAATIGAVIVLAGSRASWITFALVLTMSGCKWLGWRGLALLWALAMAMIAGLAAWSPQVHERIGRTMQAFAGDHADLDAALSGRGRIWGAAWCMARAHPFNGVGARGFRDAFAACDPRPGQPVAWGEGPALHAHQLVLELLSETGVVGLSLWVLGALTAWRAWRYTSEAGRARARPAMWALAATVFPFNTHLAFHSTFWGGLTLLLAALYAGSLWGYGADRCDGG